MRSYEETSTHQNRCPHMLTTASFAVSKHILHSKLSPSPPSPPPWLPLAELGDGVAMNCSQDCYHTRQLSSRDIHVTSVRIENFRFPILKEFLLQKRRVTFRRLLTGIGSCQLLLFLHCSPASAIP